MLEAQWKLKKTTDLCCCSHVAPQALLRQQVTLMSSHCFMFCLNCAAPPPKEPQGEQFASSSSSTHQQWSRSTPSLKLHPPLDTLTVMHPSVSVELNSCIGHCAGRPAGPKQQHPCSRAGAAGPQQSSQGLPCKP